MKQLLSFLFLIFIFSTSAEAVTRDNRRLRSDTGDAYGAHRIELRGGYESINSSSDQITGITQLSSTQSVPIAELHLCASADNTGVIHFGASNISAQTHNSLGPSLSAGDCQILHPDDLNDVYVDASVSGDWIGYTYFEYF